MGYFSNGTEGSMYEERYCDRCVHGQKRLRDIDPEDCPVLLVHAIYNYDQNHEGAEAIKAILDALIPVDAEGWNEQCAMFRPLPAKPSRRPKLRFPLFGEPSEPR